MSLYRTWRPSTFDDLVGQDAVVQTLRTALSSGRLAQAYLFSGPRGCGKTSAAKIFARCLQCTGGPTPQPDNICEHCRAITAGTALDVLEIDAASNRGVDEIRSLRDALKLPPTAMRSKVYIIDEAHMLTTQGAAAFLKAIEEPPPYAVFILATTAPDDLPQTILSRCQRYAFRRITVETMIDRMSAIAAAENITIDDDALGAIAYRADGGLRDALTMLEQVAAFAGSDPATIKTVEATFGPTNREYAQRLLAAGLAGNAADALQAIDEACDGGADMTGLVRGTIDEFRHLLVGRLSPQLLGRDLSRADADRVLERVAATVQPRIMRGLRLLNEALTAARGSGDARLELETAVLRFILQPDDPTVKALTTRITELEARATAGPLTQTDEPGATAAGVPSDRVPAVQSTRQESVEALPARPTVLPTPGELSLQKIRSLWMHVRSQAEAKKPSLGATLTQTTVTALDGTLLTLTVPDRARAQLLATNLPTLKIAVGDVLGKPLEIRIAVTAAA